MHKRINFIFSVGFLFLLFQLFSPPILASTTQSLRHTFIIQAGNAKGTYDKNGNKILKAVQTGGVNILKLDELLNGRTAELPIGSIIFLHFPTGQHNITITPAKGIIEGAPGKYNLPKGDIAVLKVVGQGTATITVTTNLSSKQSKIVNAANNTYNWAGYERTTGGPFTDITSNWIVPTASASSGDTYSSAWAGIDDGNDTNHDLIQIGTASDYLSGSPSYIKQY
jgi:hypothetical protein